MHYNTQDALTSSLISRPDWLRSDSKQMECSSSVTIRGPWRKKTHSRKYYHSNLFIRAWSVIPHLAPDSLLVRIYYLVCSVASYFLFFQLLWGDQK